MNRCFPAELVSFQMFYGFLRTIAYKIYSIGVPFPKTFPSLLRQLFKRLYRVYAHIYCHHYPVVVHLGLEPHLNTSFKHYVLFIDEHKLASGKDYWGPLGDLVDSMLRSD